jgi:hypothetical protein
MGDQWYHPSYPWETPSSLPTVQEAGWASEPIGTDTENLTPLGFKPQTVQPAASCYIDYAISAHSNECLINQVLYHEEYVLEVNFTPLAVLTSGEKISMSLDGWLGSSHSQSGQRGIQKYFCSWQEMNHSSYTSANI